VHRALPGEEVIAIGSGRSKVHRAILSTFPIPGLVRGKRYWTELILRLRIVTIETAAAASGE
jgi:hypothetical protein